MRGKSRARVEPHGGFRSHLGSGLASQIGCKQKKQPLADRFSLESAAEERLKELCCSQVGEGQQREAFATSTVRKGQVPHSHPAPQTPRFCLVQLEGQMGPRWKSSDPREVTRSVVGSGSTCAAVQTRRAIRLGRFKTPKTPSFVFPKGKLWPRGSRASVSSSDCLMSGTSS